MPKKTSEEKDDSAIDAELAEKLQDKIKQEGWNLQKVGLSKSIINKWKW